MGWLDRYRRDPYRINPARHRLKPGDEWRGPRAWTTDFPDTVPCPGFYALTPDGSTFLRPLVRLIQIDLVPGDPEDGSEKFIVAGPKDRAQVPGDQLVNVELHAEGKSSVL